MDYDLEALGHALMLPRPLEKRLASGQQHRTEEKPVIQSRREQLAVEVTRHREKLDKAEARLAALEGIPDRDPFPDGTVLKVQARPYRRLQTYVLLRVGGYWYATGQTGPNKVSWHTLVDWLVACGVLTVTPMIAGEPTMLGALDEPDQPAAVYSMPIERCKNAGEDHGEHMWRTAVGEDDMAEDPRWCPGQTGPEAAPTRTCDYINQEDHEPHWWKGVRLGSGDAPRVLWCPGA